MSQSHLLRVCIFWCVCVCVCACVCGFRQVVSKVQLRARAAACPIIYNQCCISKSAFRRNDGVSVYNAYDMPQHAGGPAYLYTYLLTAPPRRQQLIYTVWPSCCCCWEIQVSFSTAWQKNWHAAQFNCLIRTSGLPYVLLCFSSLYIFNEHSDKYCNELENR